MDLQLFHASCRAYAHDKVKEVVADIPFLLPHELLAALCKQGDPLFTAACIGNAILPNL